MHIFKPAAAEQADPDKHELSGYPWGKVIRRELFSSALFPESMASQDTIFAFVLHSLAKGYVSLSKPVYHYRVNPVGLSADLQKNARARRLLDRAEDARQAASARHAGRAARVRRSADAFRRAAVLALKNFDDSIKQAVFYLCCHQIDALRSEFSGARALKKVHPLDYAFRTRQLQAVETAVLLGGVRQC